MAKEFSRAFYNSANWKRTRDAYVAERVSIDGGMCERCKEELGEELHHKTVLSPENIGDSSITVSRDNLIFLCKDCHFREHRRMILEKYERWRASRRKLTDNWSYFDEDGELKRVGVKIVWGAPASGKTTYVREHMQVGDLVLDLDAIKQAISMQPRGLVPDNLLPAAMEMRECIFRMVEEKRTDSKNIWVIGCMSKRDERLQLAKRLGGELVHVDTGYHECLRRARDAPDRENRELECAIIDRYFERLEK